MNIEELIVDGKPTTELIYEGKSKQIFATDDPSIVIVHYKDDASAYNGIKRAQITNKGIYNNHISAIIYSLVEQAGIHTHFIRRIDDRNQLCYRLQALPLQVVARNRIAGSCATNLGLPVGFKPQNIVYEYSYKNDELDDPIINEHHAVALGLATYEELDYIHNQMVKLNEVLTHIFENIKIDLIDFKVEFGRLPNGELLLSDEISPDTCRIWDMETQESLDKDRFRRDLGRVGEAYKEILTRLSIYEEFTNNQNKKVMKALTATEYNFPQQTKVYHGKVRDVYTINEDCLVMVATDRISAFDVILPKGIPFKGQILNQIAAKFLDATADICPNWKMATPDPMVTVGVALTGYPVEMIVRGYLCGSAWRAYKSGVREICGVKLPDGMRENEKFPTPIITPTTKAEIGEHDEDISKEEIIARGLVSAEEYAVLEKYTLALFERGSQIAAQRGLILVDTKYEFGHRDGKIYLMDEIHTPDSSRYFYAEGYEENFAKGLPQKQLSKEFVREWLMENGFQGKEGQQVPEMTDEVVESISARYRELYENIIGAEFVPAPQTEDIAARIESNVKKYIKTLC